MSKVILIEIKSTEVRQKSGTSGRGKPYSIREQGGYAMIPGKAYPVEIRFALEDGALPYNTGIYEIRPESYFVGNFGDLKLGRLLLDPVSRSSSAAPAVAAAK